VGKNHKNYKGSGGRGRELGFNRRDIDQCHTGVMEIELNCAKRRTKTEKRRQIRFARFHQNLLNPLDLSRLRQIMIKLLSGLLTEGLIVRI
jgi:hypothetical protein